MTIREKCALAQKASPALAQADAKTRNGAILKMAQYLRESADELLAANETDMRSAGVNGVPEAMLDRLRLTPARIEGIAAALEELAQLADPLGGGEVWRRPNGLEIKRVHVPLGVIAIIYESRPNVTADAAALCVKSGNAAVLRGGKEAIHSNLAIVTVLKRALADAGIDSDVLAIAEDTSRETATELMRMNEYVDLLIPRGGKGLIRSVVENATVPTIETGAGNCNAYVEKSADFETALSIIRNGKTSRPAVCNALEHVLVDREIAKAFLPLLKDALPGVKLKGDAEAAAILGVEEVGDDEFFVEYDDLILSAKVVGGIEEAIAHINTHSTKHSDVILTTDLRKADAFTRAVDSAAVYVNASTRFTDGGAARARPDGTYGADDGEIHRHRRRTNPIKRKVGSNPTASDILCSMRVEEGGIVMGCFDSFLGGNNGCCWIIILIAIVIVCCCCG